MTNSCLNDGMLWMNQERMVELFGTSVPTFNTHTSKVLKEKELDRISVIKDHLTTAQLADEQDLKTLENQLNKRKPKKE
jgi:hypothetical protein